MWSFSKGIQANQSEAQWSGIPGFCPVIKSFAGLINIYPRAEQVTFQPDYKSITKFDHPTDDKIENTGLLNGELVWVDYDMSWEGCICESKYERQIKKEK